MLRIAYVVWVPISVSLALGRFAPSSVQTTQFALIDYPKATAGAVFVGLSLLVWVIFSILVQYLPPRIIRENTGRESYLEKIAKIYGSESDWPQICTDRILAWDKADRPGTYYTRIIVCLIVLASVLAIGGLVLLAISLQRFAPSIFH